MEAVLYSGTADGGLPCKEAPEATESYLGRKVARQDDVQPGRVERSQLQAARCSDVGVYVHEG